MWTDIYSSPSPRDVDWYLFQSFIKGCGLIFIPDIPKFSRNVGTTSYCYAPQEWHQAGAILKVLKCKAPPCKIYSSGLLSPGICPSLRYSVTLGQLKATAYPKRFQIQLETCMTCGLNVIHCTACRYTLQIGWRLKNVVAGDVTPSNGKEIYPLFGGNLENFFQNKRSAS
jgi:hypothetical protein